jgi:hypothetical protein
MRLMLRTLLLLLLVANLGVFAWTQGWLDPFLPAPGMSEREPARLAGQVNVQSVQVLPATATPAAAAASRPNALSCLEAGPFGLVDAAGAEAALEAAGLASGSWERELRGPAQVWLRIPRADSALRERLQALAAANPALATGFRACAP